MSYSLGLIYGGDDKIPAATAPVSRFKRMLPPMETLADGTIEITGFVPGVTVKEWKFDEEKNQLVVTYAAIQDGEEATIRDWYTDPIHDSRYIKQEDPAKKEMIASITLNTIKGIVQRYVYTAAINNKLKELPATWTFEQYVTLLGELLSGDKDKVKQDVSLKLVFDKSEGVEYKVKVGKNKFIGKTGDDKFGPSFIKKGNDFDDITNFNKVEKTEDFSNDELGGIDDVFSGSVDVALL